MNEIDRLQIIDQVLNEFRQRNGVPAVGASIVDSDGEAISHVVGVRRRDSSGEAVVSDRWHIGSCTKSMTAALWARLGDLGLAEWITGSSVLSGHWVRGGVGGGFQNRGDRLRIEVGPPGGGEPYAYLRVVGRSGRGGGPRRRRRAGRAVGVAHPDPGAPGVWGLRRAGVVEGRQPGAPGGPAGVRPSGAPGVAQVALALPGGELWGRLVHRDRRGDRAGALSPPAIPSARPAWPGTPKRPSAASMTSTAPNSPAPTSANSQTTSPPPPARRSCAAWAAPSAAGTPRSSTGTAPVGFPRDRGGML